MTQIEIKKIEKKYKKAHSIHCLNLNKEVEVINIPRLQFNQDNNTVTSPSGIVCFWKAGEFAKIVKIK